MTLSSDKIWSIPERYPVEIDQELAILLISGNVEAGTEAEDADGVGVHPPG